MQRGQMRHFAAFSRTPRQMPAGAKALAQSMPIGGGAMIPSDARRR